MIEWVVIPVFVVGQILASRGISRLGKTQARMLLWSMVMMTVAGTVVLLASYTAVPRMIGICMVLLAGMKALVYVEWSESGKRSLGWKEHMVFGFLWFGMNPGAFQKKTTAGGGGRWIVEGVAILIMGAVLALIVSRLGWDSVWALFIPLSLGFHYGALRVMAGLARASGYPVKPLFRNPFEAETPADFWAKRWNLGYSHMMALAVGRPLMPLLGRNGSVMAAFLISGLLHELAITVPVNAGYGLPTLYFVLQGFLVMAPFHRLPAPVGRVATAAVVMVPLPMLFPESFRREVLEPIMETIPATIYC